MFNYNEHRDYFEKCRTETGPQGLVMKFAELRNDESIKSFIFVEGSSDKTFYGSTDIDLLTESARYLFSASEWNDGGANIAKRGKSAVCDAFYKMHAQKTFEKDMRRCFFIVDRDYDNNDEDIKIRITKGHSMESYFFSKENMSVVFNKLRLTEDDFNTFWKLYTNFSKKASDFFALNGACTYATNLEKEQNICPRIRYRKLHRNEDIFCFKFDRNSVEFREDLMNEEIGFMRKKVDTDHKYYDRYIYLYRKIKNNPDMIRGHDAFRFFKEYLYQVKNIIVNDNLKELIPIIHELNVTFGP